MDNSVELLPGAVSELLVSVSKTGVLTIADRYGLKAAILTESLDEEDKGCVNRIVRGVIKGKIKIVDEISYVEQDN